MRKKLLGIRLALGLTAFLGWWGMLYPELTLTPDTVVIRSETGDGDLREEVQEWDFDGSLYRALMDASPDKISFRSKLLEDFSSLLEAFHNGDK